MCSVPLDDSSWCWNSPHSQQLQSWNLSCVVVYLVWLVLDKVLAPRSCVLNAQQWVQLLNMGLFSAVVCISVWLLRPSCAARPPWHCPDKAFPDLDEPRKKKKSKTKTLFEESMPISNNALQSASACEASNQKTRGLWTNSCYRTWCWLLDGKWPHYSLGPVGAKAKMHVRKLTG